MSSVEQAIIHFKNVLIKLERRTTSEVADPYENVKRFAEENPKFESMINTILRCATFIDKAPGTSLDGIELKNLVETHLPRVINSYLEAQKSVQAVTGAWDMKTNHEMYDILRSMMLAAIRHAGNITDERPEQQFEAEKRFVETKYGS